MARLRDVLAYLCDQYPYRQELSKARLTKMVYLADWRSAITRGSQITNVEWRYNYYGPYVDDIVGVANSDPAFEIVQTVNVYGGRKDIIQLVNEAKPDWSSLTGDDVAILDFVITKTSPMYWNDFIKLVYSTYPIMSQPRHSTLDLVQLAQLYEAADEVESSEEKAMALLNEKLSDSWFVSEEAIRELEAVLNKRLRQLESTEFTAHPNLQESKIF